MAKEIERKFLFDPARVGNLGEGQYIVQAYIATVNDIVVRVRISGSNAFLTLKGKTHGATRSEFEYSIPLVDAEEIIAELCGGPVIRKIRYEVYYKGSLWELDVFHGENSGLNIAEIELENENQQVELPEWVGKEVTGDPRYYNNNLLVNPYRRW